MLRKSEPFPSGKGKGLVLYPNSCRFALLAACLLVLTHCADQSADEQPAQEKKALARVFDEYLYKQETQKLITADMSQADSIEVVNNYIDNWVRRRLFFNQASKQLSNKARSEIENKIKDYRESLINYQYEKQLVANELDTTVQRGELKRYYRNNQGNFELSHNIAKVRFVKVVKNAPNIDQARQWLVQSSRDARSRLESYCYQYGDQFSLNDTSWHRLSHIARWLPLNTAELTKAAQARKSLIQANDQRYLYLLKIDELKTKNTTAPFSFVKDKIKKVVLNKRKVNLIQKKHNEIYARGQEKNRFEIF